MWPATHHHGERRRRHRHGDKSPHFALPRRTQALYAKAQLLARLPRPRLDTQSCQAASWGFSIWRAMAARRQECDGPTGQ